MYSSCVVMYNNNLAVSTIFAGHLWWGCEVDQLERWPCKPFVKNGTSLTHGSQMHFIFGSIYLMGKMFLLQKFIVISGLQRRYFLLTERSASTSKGKQSSDSFIQSMSIECWLMFWVLFRRLGPVEKEKFKVPALRKMKLYRWWEG